MPHDHGHGHGHDQSRDHGHPHPSGHNRAPADHLHSHIRPDDEAIAIQALAGQLIEGFKAASDKAAFLRLAGVPMETPSPTGGDPLKLVDVRISSEWSVAAVSPAFGGGALSHQPYPGDLIKERVNGALVYVSLQERVDVDFRDFVSSAAAEG